MYPGSRFGHAAGGKAYGRLESDLREFTKQLLADRMHMNLHKVDKIARSVYRKLIVHTHGCMVCVAMLAGLV